MAAAMRKHVFTVMLGKFNTDDQNSRNSDNQLSRILREYECLNDEQGSISDWITKVNSSINSRNSRERGLVFLHQLVQQCNGEIFIQHCTGWLHRMLQLLQSGGSVAVKELASLVVAEILQQVPGEHELVQQVAISVVPQLIPVLLVTRLQSSVGSWKCLYACMRYFPSSCGPMKSKIQSLLVDLMSTNAAELTNVKALSECFALLPQCGSSGHHGINYTTSWMEICEKVLGSMNDALDLLYVDFNTGGTSSQSGIFDQSLLIGEHFHTSSLFCTLGTCLQQLLVGDMTAVVVCVPHDNILALICRAHSINASHLGFSVDHAMLAAVLPKIHCSAFKLLRALILCCRRQLIPSSRVINQLFVQALKWMTSTSSPQKLFSTLKETVYAVLADWLIVTGAVSGIEEYQDQLIEHIASDIMPPSTILQLHVVPHQLTASSSPKKGKKKRKGGGVNAESTSAQHNRNLRGNERVVSSALKAIRLLIYSSGMLIKPKHHQALHELIIHTLLEIQQGKKHVTYAACPSCRKELYHVLLSFMLVPHPRLPPPLHVALRLFATGQNDGNIEVSSFCIEALTACEAIIHPRVPSLQLPMLIEKPTRPAQSPVSKHKQTAVEQALPVPSGKQEHEISPFKEIWHPGTSDYVDGGGLPSSSDVCISTERKDDHDAIVSSSGPDSCTRDDMGDAIIKAPMRKYSPIMEGNALAARNEAEQMQLSIPATESDRATNEFVGDEVIEVFDVSDDEDKALASSVLLSMEEGHATQAKLFQHSERSGDLPASVCTRAEDNSSIELITLADTESEPPSVHASPLKRKASEMEGNADSRIKSEEVSDVMIHDFVDARPDSEDEVVQ